MGATDDLLVRIEGAVGHITINRPRALNAITPEIVHRLLHSLVTWSQDEAVRLVLADANGDKAFSAGGDLALLYQAGRSGDYETGRQFWRDEYRLNLMIAKFAKPYVAVMDGIVMGGGVGISSHGSHRIVTESSMVAMPECGIGLIPDVGGTYLLGRAPGHLGEYLGLTGRRMNAGDAIYAGFADMFVERTRLAGLKTDLIATGDVSVIGHHASEAPPSDLEPLAGDIDAIFSAETLSEVMRRLGQADVAWAAQALGAMQKASPLSLATTFAAIRRARSKHSLEDALSTEYRFVSRSMEHGDFLEGIRALVVDKDRNPKWRHRDLDDLPPDLVLAMQGESEGGDPDFRRGGV